MVTRARRSEASIRQILAELSTSGESVAAFARQRGLSAWTLYDWRRKYGTTGEPEPRGPVRQAPSLARVRLKDASRDAGDFEVRVGAVAISVPYGFDDRELLRLLTVVKSC